MSGLLIALAMLVLSAFFSGSEIAFVNANNLKIELKTKQGLRSAQILSDFKKNVSEVLITILIGNNLALVVFTTQMARFTDPLLTQMGLSPATSPLLVLLLQSLISTIIILTFAEYIPKAIFRRNADSVVFPVAYVLRFFFLILYVPVRIVNFITKSFIRIFGLNDEEEDARFSSEDLEIYIQELIEINEKAPQEHDVDPELLSNALEFRETKVRDFMIPRTEIVALPMDTSLDKLLEKFIETKLSKIIIYDENLDDIRGFVHSNGFFKRPETFADLLQPVLIIPETMGANDLLAELSSHHKSVAIIVDEFGGTAGMITVEDLVEEVFGEIEDEYYARDEEVDEDEQVLRQDDGSYVLGARNEISYLNDDLDLELPEDDTYSTLAGLIIQKMEDIPKENVMLDIPPYRITVLKATSTRIIKVKLEHAKIAS